MSALAPICRRLYRRLPLHPARSEKSIHCPAGWRVARALRFAKFKAVGTGYQAVRARATRRVFLASRSAGCPKADSRPRQSLNPFSQCRNSMDWRREGDVISHLLGASRRISSSTNFACTSRRWPASHASKIRKLTRWRAASRSPDRFSRVMAEPLVEGDIWIAAFDEGGTRRRSQETEPKRAKHRVFHATVLETGWTLE